MLIDATYGRQTRAVIITDSDHVVMAVQPETVANRLNSKDGHLLPMMNNRSRYRWLKQNKKKGLL